MNLNLIKPRPLKAKTKTNKNQKQDPKKPELYKTGTLKSLIPKTRPNSNYTKQLKLDQITNMQNSNNSSNNIITVIFSDFFITVIVFHNCFFFKKALEHVSQRWLFQKTAKYCAQRKVLFTFVIIRFVKGRKNQIFLNFGLSFRMGFRV